MGVPTLFVATKVDKLSRAAAEKRLRELAGVLDVEEGDVIAFSAQTGEGRTDLAAAVVSLLEAEAP